MGTYPASKVDKAAVLLMFEQLFEETRKYGSAIRPGENTSRWVASAFDAAVQGAGACLVTIRDNTIVGTSLAVETPWPYDTDYGRTAFGIGTYVQPDWRKVGIADELYRTMKRELRSRGFETYMGGALVENKAVHGVLKRNGATFDEFTVLFDLGEPSP